MDKLQILEIAKGMRVNVTDVADIGDGIWEFEYYNPALNRQRFLAFRMHGFRVQHSPRQIVERACRGVMQDCQTHAK